MRVDENVTLANSTDVTNISMESTSGDASSLDGNNRRHNRRIHNMVRAGLLDSNQHKTFCCEVET